MSVTMTTEKCFVCDWKDSSVASVSVTGTTGGSCAVLVSVSVKSVIVPAVDCRKIRVCVCKSGAGSCIP